MHACPDLGTSPAPSPVVARERCTRGKQNPPLDDITHRAGAEVLWPATSTRSPLRCDRPTATRRVRRKVKFVIAPERRGAISIGCWRHDSLDRRLAKRDMCCGECTKAHKVFDRRSEDLGVSCKWWSPPAASSRSPQFPPSMTR